MYIMHNVNIFMDTFGEYSFNLSLDFRSAFEIWIILIKITEIQFYIYIFISIYVFWLRI